MSAVLSVVIALIVFVITQSILKFVIEPIQEQKRLIGEVAHALSIYAYIQDVRKEGDEPEKTLRSLSGRLWASLWSIPFYDALASLGIVPKATDVMAAATELRIWSYSVTSFESADSNMRHMDAIAQRLGITLKGNPLKEHQ
jgi:hypothetical protein